MQTCECSIAHADVTIAGAAPAFVDRVSPLADAALTHRFGRPYHRLAWSQRPCSLAAKLTRRIRSLLAGTTLILAD